MAKTKKRPKYVEEIVDKVNEFFYNKKEKDHLCDLAIWLDNFLLSKNMYKGFNFFKDVERNGKIYKVLAGSADPTQYEYIQFY